MEKRCGNCKYRVGKRKDGGALVIAEQRPRIPNPSELYCIMNVGLESDEWESVTEDQMGCHKWS